jgi:hypothetical protein
MPQQWRLEFFLLRYAANGITDQFVDIGLVLFDPDSLAEGFCDARFLDDWGRLESIDPNADTEMLGAIADDIQKQLRNPVQREDFLRMMEDSFSSPIRLSPRRACITEDPVLEIDSLARLYLRGVSGNNGNSCSPTSAQP